MVLCKRGLIQHLPLLMTSGVVAGIVKFPSCSREGAELCLCGKAVLEQDVGWSFHAVVVLSEWGDEDFSEKGD